MANRIYDAGTPSESFGCGVIPGDFEMLSEVFTSGPLIGTVPYAVANRMTGPGRNPNKAEELLTWM